MVGIQGIGGIPEPRPERPSNTRDNRTGPSADAEQQSSDGVVISSEAQAAAAVARIIQASESQPEVRTERVEEARAAVERGDFRRPEVVRVVAERLSRLL